MFELIDDAPTSQSQFAEIKSLSLSSRVTLILIAINVLVFVVMTATGVSFLTPTARETIPWGASFGPLTTGGQWWRLLTACFVHFGIVHIAFNMFILLLIGGRTEVLFGTIRFLLIYLLAGIGGNIAGLYAHPLTTSAGASGAIFGLYGALLAFLLVRPGVVPEGRAFQIGLSAVFFIGYNFLSGITDAKTDIVGHVGGLLTGFVVAALVARPRSAGTNELPVRRTAAVAVTAIVLAAAALRAAPKDKGRSDTARLLMLGHTVLVGNNGQVVYKGSATKADAQRLADEMRHLGFFKEPGNLITLDRDAAGTSIAIPVGKDESTYATIHSVTSRLVNGKTVIVPADIAGKQFPWDDPTKLALFQSLGISVAPSVGGVPIRLLLLNNKGELRKTLIIDTREVTIGTLDTIRYSGSATLANAQSLGKALQNAGFFHDRGTKALLSQGKDGTSVSFIVKDGAWDDPRVTPAFQTIGHKIASAVGGPPLTVNLLDTSLQPRKAIVIR